MISNIENLTDAGTTLAEIEQRTKRFADARTRLAEEVSELNANIEALKRKAMPLIKNAVNRATERESELRNAIESAPALFEKPRTVVFYGVKVGYQKGKGSIEISDPETTVARLKKIFRDNWDQYVHVKETPDKKAIAELPAAELKALGVTVEDTGDQVVIKPTDTAVDKIVNALLKGALEEAKSN